jgi:hypothetical protein
MVKRIVQWIGLSLLALIIGIGSFVAYLYASPVPFREFDDSWYHTKIEVTEALGQSFLAHHRSAVFRAMGDHFVYPVGPGRIMGLLAASAPDDSGNVFLFFGCRFASGDVGLHELPVYCWSQRQQRLLWKGLQNNSP